MTGWAAFDAAVVAFAVAGCLVAVAAPVGPLSSARGAGRLRKVVQAGGEDRGGRLHTVRVDSEVLDQRATAPTGVERGGDHRSETTSLPLGEWPARSEPSEDFHDRRVEASSPTVDSRTHLRAKLGRHVRCGVEGSRAVRGRFGRHSCVRAAPAQLCRGWDVIASGLPRRFAGGVVLTGATI